MHDRAGYAGWVTIPQTDIQAVHSSHVLQCLSIFSTDYLSFKTRFSLEKRVR